MPSWIVVPISLLVVLLIDGGVAAGAPGKDLHEKEPPLPVRALPETVRATDKFVPAPTHPEPAWPTGIRETGQAPLPASLYRIENQWHAVVGGEHVNVYAGELVESPGQGVLVIQSTPVDLSHSPSAPRILHGPQSGGALRIVSATSDTLNVRTATGRRLVFHVASRELQVD